MEYKIICNGERLDVSEFEFDITYDLNDIEDISKRNNSYSKEIILPGTNFNNNFFEHLYDVNVQFLTFNPKIKQKATIFGGDGVLLDGYLQLVDIIRVDQQIEYKVVVSGILKSIFDDLGDLYLSDLDFSEYNHIRNKTNILNSWDYSVVTNGNLVDYFVPGTGYVYPYIINGNSSNIWDTLYIYDIFPALYFKTITDKIFSNLGYTVDSKFFNSDYFKKIILPFNEDKIQRTAEDIDNYTVRAGVASDVYDEYTNGYTMLTGELGQGNPWYYNSDFSYDLKLLKESGSSASGIEWQDPQNQWNRYGGYVCNKSGYYDISVDVKLVARYSRTSVGGGNLKYTGNAQFEYRYGLYIQRVGQAPTAIYETATNLFSPSDGALHSSPWYDFANPLTFNLEKENIFLNPGDKLLVRLGARFPDTGNNWKNSTGGSVGVTMGMAAKESLDGVSTSLIVKPSTDQDYGNSMIDINSAIPKIKAKDFLLSIVRAFNLIIYPDKNNQNKLLIEPETDFYQTRKRVKDWTHLVERNRAITLKPTSSIDKRNYIYKYDKDDDFYNKQYLEETKKDYGSLTVFVKNDFSEVDDKTELLFAATPVSSENIDNRVAPFFVNYEDGAIKSRKVKPRMLFYGGKINGGTLKLKDGNNDTGITLTNYAYAGTYDNPYNGIYSLGFGYDEKIYHPANQAPIKNLFNEFHRDKLEMITSDNGRIMECYLWLTNQDIADFDFRDIIYIDDAYWRVLKIDGYNPVSDELTKVKFIKITNIDIFLKDNINIPISQVGCPNDISLKKSKNGFVLWSSSGQIITEYCCKARGGQYKNGVCNMLPLVPASEGGFTIKGSGDNINTPVFPVIDKPLVNQKDGNTIYQTDLIVRGRLNILGDNTQESIVLGVGNTTSNVKSSIIIGDGNSVNGELSGTSTNLVVGNNNIIESGSTNVVLFGNGITATTGNTLYTNNIQITSGGTLNGITVNGLTGSTLWSGGTGLESIFRNNGTGNIASGDYSHAEGEGTQAIGYASHAEGSYCIAGDYSHAEGEYSEATGYASHAENGGAAYGDYSHAEGSSIANGNYSHAEGGNTTANGNYSHAEGFQTTASGLQSHAEGRQTIASGDSAHAEGYLTIASGNYSHAEGYQTSATTLASHAEGRQTIASGAYSHAEGYQTSASGNYSHTEGYLTIASGNYSHAGGYANTATTQSSAAVGGESNKIISAATKSTILGGFLNEIKDTSEESSIIGGSGNKLSLNSRRSTILGGQNNEIINATASSIIGGSGNKNYGDGTVILGGINITGTSSYTTYVPKLNIQTIGSGAPIINLGLDSNGFVVTGTTPSGSYLPLSGGVMTGPITADTISMQSTKVIKSENGGGQIDLDAYGNPNSILISNDNAAYSDATIYMQNNYLELGSWAGNINAFASGTIDLDAGTNNKLVLSDSNSKFSRDNGSTRSVLEFTNSFGYANADLYSYDTADARVRIGVSSSPTEILIQDNSTSQIISQALDSKAIIIGSNNSSIISGVTNTVVIGGIGLSATTSNTVYVPKLNIGTVGSGTSIINLGLDSNGFVVTGTTSSGGTSNGITNLNGLTGSSQSFATSTTGTDFTISSAGSAHTFNLPTASAVNTGKLSSTDWSTFNSKQAGDATLTALAAYNTNGILTQTAADTFVGRTIVGGACIGVTNGNGVSGNPTIALTGGTMTGALTVTGNLTTNGNLTADDFEQISHAQTQTINATPTTIKTIATVSEYVYQIEANVIGGINDTSKGITSKIVASFKNNGGVVTQIGSQNIIMNSDFTGTADVTMSISGTNIIIQVVGEAATTIDWGSSIITHKMEMGVI